MTARWLWLLAVLVPLGAYWRTAERPPAASAPYSNTLPGDYVGPQACAQCHEEKYKLWQTHPHSRMNQPATPATVKADFSGTQVDYAGKIFVFTRAGGEFVIEQRDGAKRERAYRMLLTVGSTFQQMFIGVQTFGPEPPGDVLYRTPLKMPFGYWFRLQRWLPVAYFDTYFQPEYDEKGAFNHTTTHPERYVPWQNNCAFCHNTYPYELALIAGGVRAGYPRGDLKLTASPRDRASFERLRAGFLLRADLVTTGISCESCHLGGREHAVEQRGIRFMPFGPYLEFPKAQWRYADRERAKQVRRDPYVINNICAECHSANVPKYANGAAVINSREARDLESGRCASQLKCTDCHDPHVPLPPPSQRDEPARFETEAQKCLKCHGQYADAAARRKHAGHGPGVNCLDCHMPRVTQGLDFVVHSHRISAPVEATMVAAGHPNACNLCHLDRSLAWTLDQLRKTWGRSLAADPAWARWYGEKLARPVGEVWAAHPDSVVRLVAADAYAREASPARSVAGVVRVLDDGHAVNRVFGLLALEHALKRRVAAAEYDPMAPHEKRVVQIEALRKIAR